jgi:hypothetical protein
MSELVLQSTNMNDLLVVERLISITRQTIQHFIVEVEMEESENSPALEDTEAALCRGVTPYLSATLIFAPSLINISTMA